MTTYQIDPVHSELTFRVRHLLGRVPGTFRDWGGTVAIDAARFKDPWGKMRTAFTASTTNNRQDFGVSFNGPFEQIGQIGDDVAIEIAIEAVQQ